MLTCLSIWIFFNKLNLPSFVSLSVSQSSTSNSSVTAIGAIKLTFPSMFLFFVASDEGTFGETWPLCALFCFGTLTFTAVPLSHVSSE